MSDTLGSVDLQGGGKRAAASLAELKTRVELSEAYAERIEGLVMRIAIRERRQRAGMAMGAVLGAVIGAVIVHGRRSSATRRRRGLSR